MSISISELRGQFTKALIDVYSNKASATSFLRSFFPTVIEDTLNVSIQVRQGTNKVAVDVIRGTEGNMNAASRSSEKVIQPPYYKETINATSLDWYDKAFGSESPSPQELASYINELAEEMVVLQDKIDRSTEVQVAQIFDTGIVNLKQATNINFRRKAGSIVDVSGSNPWSTGTNDPAENLKAAAEFIRKETKTTAATFNLIMGDQAYDAMINNDTFQKKSDLKDVTLNSIESPQSAATGSAFHGTVSAGSYLFRVWTYPQFYTPATGGAQVPYVDPKKVIVLPDNPQFKLAYGASPKLRTDMNNQPVAMVNTPGQYHIDDYIDVTKEAHMFAMKSAAIAVPTEVNAIYTMTVLP